MKTLLKLMGVPVIDAPCEAEATVRARFHGDVACRSTPRPLFALAVEARVTFGYMNIHRFAVPTSMPTVRSADQGG